MAKTPSAPAASLTQKEAAQRAATITVERYDIRIDLTGLLHGDTVTTTSTVTFAATPGSETFADCLASVSSAVLNGTPIDPATIERGRIPLTGLAETNTLVVTASQSQTSSAEGILRTVDPTDDEVYVWTSFEPDDARRLWACFDQPDLKAVHAFTVTAPERWTVLSNSAPAEVTEADGDARTWTFEDTPRLSTYVVVVNAGPFVELRSERGGYDLGLYARRSLRAQLERDAEEIWAITEHGLAWYGERFGMPFPQRRYDQTFVPDMGGAMENWGSITHTDTFVYRSAPTMPERTYRANVILHEMAHMWFGDLVTMRWWDDLWLNEAFASWAAVWASSALPEYADAWAGIGLTEKIMAYETDLSPATHPIRGDVSSVDVAMANFDAITYYKGQSVLQQLHAYIGEDAFLRGLQAYFAEHAWGNTVLTDLMDAFGRAAGRDLSGWTSAWLDHAGTDSLVLADGKVTVTAPSTPSAPAGPSDDGAERPHRLDIASYDDHGTLLATTPVTVSGASEPVALPEAAAHLLNASDVTFAAVRSDPASEAWLGTRAGLLPDAGARAVAVENAWLAMLRGEIGGAEVVARIVSVLERERNPLVTGPLLDLASKAAQYWTPPADVAAQRALVAGAAATLVQDADNRVMALRTLAAHATTDDQLELAEQGSGEDVVTGWALLTRRAELGEYDQATADALTARDPDPESWAWSLRARAAAPDPAAKEEAWKIAMVDLRLPHTDAGYGLAQAFWRPGQEELLTPYADRYLDTVSGLQSGGMLTVSLPIRFYPRFAGADFIAAARERIEAGGLIPVVRQSLLNILDTLERQAAARTM